MFGIDDALLAAGVSAAGSFFGQEDTNQTNVGLALQQQAYNTEMANTAHQREVQDLIAAGLNPILSVNKTGAPMPQSSMPVLVNPMAHATSSAVEAYKGVQEVAKSRAEQKKLEQDVKIKRPLEDLAPLVSTGVEAIKPAVEAAVTSALDAVAPVKAMLLKSAESVSGTVASGVESVAKAAEGYTEAVVDRVRESAPGKFVSSVVNSAQDAHDRVRRQVEATRAFNGPELSAREQAKRSGRRLGTLGRQPRYVPQYGVGD